MRTAPPPVPTELLEELANEVVETPRAPRPVYHDTPRRDNRVERAEKWFAKASGTRTGDGGCHNGTFATIERGIRGFDLTPEQAFPIVMRWNLENCVPPWSDAEIHHKIESGLRDGDTPIGELLNTPLERAHHANGSNQKLIDSHPTIAKQNGYVVEPPTLKRVDAMTLAETFKELRPVIIAGLLRLGELMNIVSGTKIGKSWLVLYLIFCVAKELDWLGFKTVKQRILLIDNELHEETLASRIRTVRDGMRLKDADLTGLVDVVTLRGEDMSVDGLESATREIEPGEYGMFVFDCWYRLLGGREENKNEDVTALYTILQKLAKRLNVAIVCIHHTSKGSQGSKSVTDTGSGAGSQSRIVDTHMVLRQHEEEGAIVLDAAVRSFPPNQPRCLRSEFPLWVVDESLDPTRLKTDRPRRKSDGKVDGGAGTFTLEADADTVYDLMIRDFQDGGAFTTIRDKAKLGTARTQAAIDHLMFNGRVVKLPNVGNSKFRYGPMFDVPAFSSDEVRSG